MDILEELEILDEPELPAAEFPSPAAQTKGIRAEAVMGIIALFCAALVGILALLSWPQITAKDDPEAPMLQAQLQSTEVPELWEPTVPPEEPENPTVAPEKNPFDRNDFQYNSRNYLLLQNLPSSAGVDVSAWQKEIDWEKVKASGIEFAFIRLGFRGYEGGKLNEDAYALANLDGAAAAGLKVGAYFFSQALNIKETDEEIAYMLEILGDRKLDLPIVLDWEIPAGNARTKDMDPRTLTDIQLHFIKKIKEKGLEPMVYFNRYQSETLYYLNELEDASFWLALYQDRMTYPWKVEYWQYTDKGTVPGINGPVDLNVYMPD